MTKAREREEARRLYVLQHQKKTTIAKLLHVSRRSVTNWCRDGKWDEERERMFVRSPIGTALVQHRERKPIGEERVEVAALEPAGGLPARLYFRGPRDRRQYLECLAKCQDLGKGYTVVRRSSVPNEPWIISPPPPKLRRGSKHARFARMYFGSQRSGKRHPSTRQGARRRPIEEALTGEYIREVQRLDALAREAVAFDIEEPGT